MSLLSMILKYAGLLLATVSSAWGTLNDLTEKRNGKKVLTRSGKIAMSLTGLGLAIALGSNVVDDLSKSKEVRAEVRRTMAAQPLVSLDFQWEFPAISSDIRQELNSRQKVVDDFVNDQQRDVGSDEAMELDRISRLYDFLLSYARQTAGQKLKPNKNDVPKEDDSVLVLVSLDDERNAILSFGILGSDVTWSKKKGILSNRSDVLSGGVATCGVPSQFCRFDKTKDAPRSVANWPILRDHSGTSGKQQSAVTVVWNVDPLTFANSVDRQNPAINPTARFPARLQIAIFYDIVDLPFDQPNFALLKSDSLWNDADKSKKNVEKAALSNVTLIPNKFPEGAYRYRLVQASTRGFYDSYDEEIANTGCLLLEFEAID
jgi:hypothetical protein